MEENERDDQVDSGASKASVQGSKPLPLKWIMIGIVAIVLIEVIVGIVFWLTGTHEVETASASPSPGVHSTSAPNSHGALSQGTHGTSTEHGSTSHSDMVLGSPEPSMNSEEHDDQHGQPSPPLQATAPISIPTPTPTPNVNLDQVEFPSLTFPPDGEIQVDLKDASKLLDLLSGN